MAKKPSLLSPVVLRECDTPLSSTGIFPTQCFFITLLDIMIFIRTTLKIIAALWYLSAGHCCAERGRNYMDMWPSLSRARWWECTKQSQSHTAGSSSSFALVAVAYVWEWALTPSMSVSGSGDRIGLYMGVVWGTGGWIANKEIWGKRI